MTGASSLRARLPDIVFAGAVLAVAVLVWREAAPLEAGPADQLGPGTVPIFVCAALIALAGLLLVRALLGLAIGHSTQSLILGIGDAPPDGMRRRPAVALFAFAATFAYLAAMQAGLGFLWATLAFLVAFGLLLCARSRLHLALVGAIAVVGAVGVDALFRRVFIVLLP